MATQAMLNIDFGAETMHTLYHSHMNVSSKIGYKMNYGITKCNICMILRAYFKYSHIMLSITMAYLAIAKVLAINQIRAERWGSILGYSC